jgi:hypothetical protein
VLPRDAYAYMIAWRDSVDHDQSLGLQFDRFDSDNYCGFAATDRLEDGPRASREDLWPYVTIAYPSPQGDTEWTEFEFCALGVKFRAKRAVLSHILRYTRRQPIGTWSWEFATARSPAESAYWHGFTPIPWGVLLAFDPATLEFSEDQAPPHEGADALKFFLSKLEEEELERYRMSIEVYATDYSISKFREEMLAERSDFQNIWFRTNRCSSIAQPQLLYSNGTSRMFTFEIDGHHLMAPGYRAQSRERIDEPFDINGVNVGFKGPLGVSLAFDPRGVKYANPREGDDLRPHPMELFMRYVAEHFRTIARAPIASLDAAIERWRSYTLEKHNAPFSWGEGRWLDRPKVFASSGVYADYNYEFEIGGYKLVAQSCSESVCARNPGEVVVVGSCLVEGVPDVPLMVKTDKDFAIYFGLNSIRFVGENGVHTFRAADGMTFWQLLYDLVVDTFISSWEKPSPVDVMMMKIEEGRQRRAASIQANIRSLRMSIDNCKLQIQNARSGLAGLYAELRSNNAIDGSVRDEIDQYMKLAAAKGAVSFSDQGELIYRMHESFFIDGYPDVELGPYSISLNMGTMEPTVTTMGSCSYSGVPHPHVDASGYVCWGRYAPLVNSIMDRGNPLELVMLLVGHLTEGYDKNDAYCRLDQWHGEREETGWYCDFCDAYHDDGEHCPHLCEHCDERIDDIDAHEHCHIHDHCYDTDEHDECPICTEGRESAEDEQDSDTDEPADEPATEQTTEQAEA